MVKLPPVVSPPCSVVDVAACFLDVVAGDSVVSWASHSPVACNGGLEGPKAVQLSLPSPPHPPLLACQERCLMLKWIT